MLSALLDPPEEVLISARGYTVYRDALAAIVPGVVETIEALPPFDGARVRILGERWCVDRSDGRFPPPGRGEARAPTWLQLTRPRDPRDPSHLDVRHLWCNADGTWSGGPPAPPPEPPPGSGHWVAPTPKRPPVCPWGPLVVRLDIAHEPTRSLVGHLHPEIRALAPLAKLAAQRPQAAAIVARMAAQIWAIRIAGPDRPSDPGVA